MFDNRMELQINLDSQDSSIISFKFVTCGTLNKDVRTKVLKH